MTLLAILLQLSSFRRENSGRAAREKTLISVACAWHECGLSFAGGLEGVVGAINELRSMPAEGLMAAVTIIPELDMDPSGRFAQLIGCAGHVVANVPIPAD